jgi:hypothetical protein
VEQIVHESVSTPILESFLAFHARVIVLERTPSSLVALGRAVYHDWEHRFVAAMRAAVEYHAAHCREFAGLVDTTGARALRTLADVESMPYFFVGVFKQRPPISVPPEAIAIRLTSSGTVGDKSEVVFDAVSWNRMLVADYRVHEGMGVLEQDEPCNVQLFGYDRDAAPTLGAAVSSEIIADMAAFVERRALIHDRRGHLAFDLEAAVNDYLDFVASGRPLRWIGYPAFMYRTLLALAERRAPIVPNPQSSWVQPAGGWKSQAANALDRETFAHLTERTLGVPRDHVRDLFGMAEHGIGYLECEKGRLHVPAYAHAVVRDVRTLDVLPPGQPGLLHLYSPLMRGMPSISLLTTDEAIIDVRPCPCGRPGRGLHPLRRVGLADYETCAIRALQYIET